MADNLLSPEDPTAALDLARAEFVKEAHTLDQLPPDAGMEIAFAGRSNAGKSSAINALCGRRKLARTSRARSRATSKCDGRSRGSCSSSIADTR